MGSANDELPVDPDGEPEPFAGDLFLELALDGRLVLDVERADQLIASVEHTLAVIRARAEAVDQWWRLPSPAVGDLDPAAQRLVVEAVFLEQVSPGQLARAMVELPKYVAAFHLAKRRWLEQNP